MFTSFGFVWFVCNKSKWNGIGSFGEWLKKREKKRKKREKNGSANDRDSVLDDWLTAIHPSQEKLNEKISIYITIAFLIHKNSIAEINHFGETFVLLLFEFGAYLSSSQTFAWWLQISFNLTIIKTILQL